MAVAVSSAQCQTVCDQPAAPVSEGINIIHTYSQSLFDDSLLHCIPFTLNNIVITHRPIEPGEIEIVIGVPFSSNMQDLDYRILYGYDCSTAQEVRMNYSSDVILISVGSNNYPFYITGCAKIPQHITLNSCVWSVAGSPINSPIQIENNSKRLWIAISNPYAWEGFIYVYIKSNRSNKHQDYTIHFDEKYKIIPFNILGQRVNEGLKLKSRNLIKGAVVTKPQ
tara:strand:- start:7589 stop:8260 length:672 start_codon:yes stop_codon:yes gene_type:complete